MNPTSLCHSVLAASILCCTGVRAQSDRISFLEGALGTAQSLRVFDPSGTGTVTTFATDLTILPIDKTQRTVMTDRDPEHARRVQRQGLTSIELPSGGGRVLRYRRASAGAFGFLLIRDDGRPQILLEMNGVVDPFEARVGVAPDGRHGMILDRLGGGWLVRLDGGIYASSGGPARRLAGLAAPIEPDSASPGASRAFFVTGDDRIWRVDYTDGALPVDVTPPPPGAGSEADDEFAMSSDGSAVAILFGPRRLESIYVIGSAGAARRLAAPPADYEEPGYLPGTVGGPFMLLNGDATRLLYVDSTRREEYYLADTTGQSGTTQITSDPNFQPYIGIGILPSFAGNTATLAIGDPARHDWFAATTGGVATPRNLSGTGTLAAPFGAGQLDPQLGACTRVGGVLSTERDSVTGQWRLRLVAPALGTVWTRPIAPGASMRVGRGFVGAPSWVVSGASGDTLVDADQGAVVLATPPGIEIGTELREAADRYGVFVARVRSSGIASILVRGGRGLISVLTRPMIQQIALTRDGGITVQDGALRYFGPGANGVQITARPAIVLNPVTD